jgi:hypothetical protein
MIATDPLKFPQSKHLVTVTDSRRVLNLVWHFNIWFLHHCQRTSEPSQESHEKDHFISGYNFLFQGENWRIDQSTNYLLFFKKPICSWDRASLCSPGWLRTCNPPAATFWVLGLYTFTTTPDSKCILIKCHLIVLWGTHAFLNNVC